MRSVLFKVKCENNKYNTSSSELLTDIFYKYNECIGQYWKLESHQAQHSITPILIQGFDKKLVISHYSLIFPFLIKISYFLLTTNSFNPKIFQVPVITYRFYKNLAGLKKDRYNLVRTEHSFLLSRLQLKSIYIYKQMTVFSCTLCQY